MKTTDLFEAKKTHAECGDEIDAYHKSAQDALADVKKSMGTDEKAAARHLSSATYFLNKAISLAKAWNSRCE